MGREKNHASSSAIRCISPKPASDLAPQLITHVETTPAPVNDEKALSRVHATLAEKNLLPEHHLVDAGYVDATNLIESRDGYGVDLVGPTLKIDFYQAETGYDLTHFSIDWEAETVTCPPSVTRVQAGRLLKIRKANR